MLPKNQRAGRKFTSLYFENSEDPSWYNLYDYLVDLPDKVRLEKEIQIMDKL